MLRQEIEDNGFRQNMQKVFIELLSTCIINCKI